MPKTSAGIALYRRAATGLEVFLVHPGGPFWKNRDEGAWTFPKGEHDEGEDPLAAARREFREETGFDAPRDVIPLGTLRQAGGKIVRVFAGEGDCDPAGIRSMTFSLEWPPRSGRKQEFPEVDRAAWFSLEEAARRLLPSQRPLLDRLRERAAPG